MTNDSISRKKILIVDDDELHLAITENSLKDKYEVFLVNSGEEALEFLDKSNLIPDLILLDILMPVMDGWIVFDRIHDIASLKFTPILFYTSLDEENAKEKAYELGAFDFITKPCVPAVLLDKLSKSLWKADLLKQQYGS